MAEVVACPIWGTAAQLTRGSIGSGAQLISPRAGGLYGISETAAVMIGDLKPPQKAVLTTWLVDERRAGTRIPIINSTVLEEVLTSGRQMRFSQQRARFFQYLIAKNYRPGSTFKFVDEFTNDAVLHPQELVAWVGAESFGEATMLLRALAEEGYFQANKFALGDWIILTVKGYEKLEELEASGSDNRQAFVAMWFGDEMAEAYSEGIARAIRDAGFESFRIDAKEHNNRIDDEIVAEIKKSRFLVADFTCGVVEAGGKLHAISRGGVYYEAGLAHGLGMEVIFCVRRDLLGDVHFDTRQFSHIVWDGPADLREKLYNRIVATLGEAPGAPGRGKG